MSIILNDQVAGSPCVLPDLPKKGETSETEHADRIRVLFVDDDADYREAATVELESAGFDVVACADGAEMLRRFAGPAEFDVILLDWKLDTGLSIDLMPELHDSGINLPVVFLSEIPSISYEHAALDRGAVDFVDKARGVPILAKRLRLIVQLSRGHAISSNREPFEVGKLFLRPDISRAYWQGTDVDLTYTEFRIVDQLAARMGEYVTYRSIYDCVHRRGFVAGYGENGFRTNVRSSIRRIRNKFRNLDVTFSEIENYPSFGYRWRVVVPIVSGDRHEATDVRANDTT